MQIEPSITVEVEPSSEVQMEPLPELEVQPSSNVKRETSPDVKMEPSLVSNEPLPKRNKNIFARLSKRVGECLRLN
jgi:hypothetical protein